MPSLCNNLYKMHYILVKPCENARERSSYIKAYEMLSFCIRRIRRTGCHTSTLHCTNTGLDLSGKTKVCVMWVALYVNLDRGWLIVFFKNGIVVWFQGIAWLCTHRSNKLSHFLADYLCNIKKAVLRRNLIKFRLVVFPLKAHRLRYTDRSQGNYVCPFCKDADETEFPLCMSKI